MKELYETNADFKRFVDAYMKKECKDLETVLSHHTVKDYAEYLKDRGDDEPALRNLWKNDEDKGC